MASPIVLTIRIDNAAVERQLKRVGGVRAKIAKVLFDLGCWIIKKDIEIPYGIVQNKATKL